MKWLKGCKYPNSKRYLVMTENELRTVIRFTITESFRKVGMIKK